MSDTKHLEDRIILAALDGERVEEGRLCPLGLRLAGDETAETLERLYVELLGLIPQELDPVVPRPEVKQSLMARIAAGTAEPAAPVAPHPRFAERARPAEPVPERPPERPRERTAVRWPWGYLAAAAVLLTVLGGFFFLHAELEQRRQVVAQLEQERQRAEALERKLGAVERRLLETTAKLQGEIVSTNRQVEFLLGLRGDLADAMRELSVRAPEAVAYCPLRPVGTEPPQPRAAGSLVMVPSRDLWYLKARNLAPTGPGEVYIVWLLDEQDAPLIRMAVAPGADRDVELRRDGIPAGMAAVALTLEPSAGPEGPSGPRILYGHRDEMERL